MTVSEVLVQTSWQMRRVLRHQRYQIADLRRDVGGIVNGDALFGLSVNIMRFNYDFSFAGHNAVAHNLSLGPVEDLSIAVYDRADGGPLRIDFDANPTFHTAADLADHQQRFLRLLTGIGDPEVSIGRLEILSAAERRTLLQEWNGPERALSAATLPQLFAAQAAKTPDAVAVVFEDEQLSYGELELRANQLAHHLRALGVGAESVVGVCLERSPALVVALLGILKAGGAYLPLDPEYPAERLHYMMADTRLAVLLTHSSVAASLTIPPGLRCVLLDQEDMSGKPKTALSTTPHPEQLVYTIFTSGSTGKPKGAANTHSGLHNRLSWMQEAYRLTSGDAVLQKTPFSFDVSVWEFFWPLITGARLVVAAPGVHRDPARLIDTIRRQNVTTLHFVPSMLNVFLAHEGVRTCTSIRRLICSGEALSAETRDQVKALLPDVCMENLYGPTEAAIDVTYWPCRGDCSGGL